MKRSEFIERVEELEYITHRTKHKIIVQKMSTHLVVIDEEQRYKINYLKCNDMELFNLCAKYAWTPIGEREEEKSYYLRKINKKFYEGEYLNHDIKYNRWLLGDNIENAQYTTKFTWKEIEVIKKEFNTELCEFVKEVAE